MNIAFKGVTAEEMSFKMNRIQMQPNTKFEIKPAFARQIQRIQENEKVHIVRLNVKIESTEEAPKPFNLLISLMGVFEVEGMETEADQRHFAIEATNILFPYLRSAATNLTADAYANPLILPVIPGGLLFPEDREQKSVSVELGASDLN
ncbi:MAG: protein-export chaperone SecB [Clostridia bacterium]|nr:protein-export chaperone SecB [Clostridia bacterium]